MRKSFQLKIKRCRKKETKKIKIFKITTKKEAKNLKVKNKLKIREINMNAIP